MKVVAISSPEDARLKLLLCQNLGYLVFIYHHVDPEHKLLRDKFLYVHDDAELKEKMNLLKLDCTAWYQIQP